jgi:uncharacterized protein YndB with AHSA1/START domain
MPRSQATVRWLVEASAQRVWEALADYEAWPDWWLGIRGVELRRRGEESGVGSVLRQRWRGRLPYTLVFDLEMLEIDQPRVLRGRASGALEGTCAWTLQDDGSVTVVGFEVDVATTRWWMNLPVPFADRVFASEFAAIMRSGREGLARRLGVGVTESG